MAAGSLMGITPEAVNDLLIRGPGHGYGMAAAHFFARAGPWPRAGSAGDQFRIVRHGLQVEIGHTYPQSRSTNSGVPPLRSKQTMGFSNAAPRG
jgi:hypothetical protein